MTGSTEIWTRIAGFKVQSANHYTIEPYIMHVGMKLKSSVSELHGESEGQQFWYEQYSLSNNLIM